MIINKYNQNVFLYKTNNYLNIKLHEHLSSINYSCGERRISSNSRPNRPFTIPIIFIAVAAWMVRDEIINSRRLTLDRRKHEAHTRGTVVQLISATCLWINLHDLAAMYVAGSSRGTLWPPYYLHCLDWCAIGWSMGEARIIIWSALLVHNIPVQVCT